MAKGIKQLYGYPLIDQTARNDIKNNYQKKTDENLQTTDKTIVGGINEVVAKYKDIENKINSGEEANPNKYVTKETGNANQITFSDGKTFQAKLDDGALKGDKGDKGEQGIQGAKGEKGDTGTNGRDGLTTSISVNGTTYTHTDGTITLPNYPTKVEEYLTQSELNNVIINGTIDSNKVYKINEKFGIDDLFNSIDPTLLKDGVYTLDNSNNITYSNSVPTDSELNLSTTTTKGLIYKGCSSLTKFVANFANVGSLNNLIFVNCDNIQRVHILNCPLASNKDSLLKMIEYLPDRNNKAWGSIIIPSNKELRLELEVSSIEKDWYFGSDILYNETELAKCYYHIKETGIIDIWESAEYGEGRRIAIADSGLKTNAKELDYSKNVGYYNSTLHLGTENNPVPCEGKDMWVAHGNAVASIILGKGYKMYGVVPKAEWVFIKIGDSDGSGYYGYQKDISRVANEYNCDLANCSFSGGEIAPRYSRASKLSISDAIDWYNGSCKGFTNYSAGNKDAWVTANERFPGCTIEGSITTSYIRNENGTYSFTNYSCKRNNIPFAEFTGVPSDYYYSEEDEDDYVPFTGTSGATPILSGRYLLAINLYIKKYGYKPNKQELIDFLKYRTFKLTGALADAQTHTVNEVHQGYGAINFMVYNANPACDNKLNLEV